MVIGHRLNMTTPWEDAAAPKQLTQEGARNDALVEQFRLILQKEVLLAPQSSNFR